MKRLFLLPTALWCLAACQTSPTTPAAAGPETPAPAKPGPGPASAAAGPEPVAWGDLTVNGQPQQELSVKQLVARLGRPDSVAPWPRSMSWLAAAACWYYGETRYDVSGPHALLAAFEVATGKFTGQLGPFALNRQTTLAEVRRYFPLAARQAEAPATAGQPAAVVSLPFYNQGVAQGAALQLVFKAGRLQLVEFFYPC